MTTTYKTDPKSTIRILNNINIFLIRKVAELEDRLRLAATYGGHEGHPCPLCTYEDGKFIYRCQMHQDMEIQRLSFIGLKAEYDRLNSLQSRTLLENQSLQHIVAGLERKIKALEYDLENSAASKQMANYSREEIEAELERRSRK